MRKANGNRAEPWAKLFLTQGSDKGLSTQHLRPNLQPIYHLKSVCMHCALLVIWVKVRTNQRQGSINELKVGTDPRSSLLMSLCHEYTVL